LFYALVVKDKRMKELKTDTCYLEEFALHHLAHIPRAEELPSLMLVEHLLVGCGVVAVTCHDAGTRCSDLQL